MKYQEDEGGSSKSVFNSMPLFIFNISSLYLFVMIGMSYLRGVGRVIEQRFSLSSSQTGLLFSCDNICSIIFSLLIGFLARRGHKPRIISVIITISGISFLVTSLPHFLFDALPVPLADSDDRIGVSGKLTYLFRLLNSNTQIYSPEVQFKNYLPANISNYYCTRSFFIDVGVRCEARCEPVKVYYFPFILKE